MLQIILSCHKIHGNCPQSKFTITSLSVYFNFLCLSCLLFMFCFCFIVEGCVRVLFSCYCQAPVIHLHISVVHFYILTFLKKFDSIILHSINQFVSYLLVTESFLIYCNVCINKKKQYCTMDPTKLFFLQVWVISESTQCFCRFLDHRTFRY